MFCQSQEQGQIENSQKKVSAAGVTENTDEPRADEGNSPAPTPQL
jgi:hypothetical protein